MSDAKRLQQLAREAETYRRQGLLEEARKKYLTLLDFVKSHKQFSTNRSLLSSLRNKIQLIEKEIENTLLDQDIPELPEDTQQLIGRLFSFSNNQDIAAVESAVALAKFGQYETALAEFQKLLTRDLSTETEGKGDEIAGYFRTMIRELREAYADIREQRAKLKHYAKEVALSYEKVKKDEILKNKLRRYVGQNLLERLVRSSNEVVIDNERREVTVLFADIRGFTTISEKMAADHVVAMLNEYFSLMVEVISNNYGILDKFIGDELMAVFGLISSNNASPSYYAVKTAIEMQGATEELMQTRRRLKKQTFEIGIGINTGNAIVGSVGSKDRMDYTVIGDCVNTAARLQSVAKGGEIIISDEVYKRAKEYFNIKKKGKVRLRNKKKPLLCYRVLRK
ncbi:MAG: hypothetical protein JRI79_05750 [Deltaproteobacteria bacterium]|nr:hypothetical protein [Deltaproteobacteria bacterium]MBW2043491.1 hypothetical protein [Deltaproteobacteria bacterium]MBW2299670.1 hypothetical protein [Deltaproteobacteria bacterium]RLB35678.1 MAG: hypothetical protein DRH11_01955 [Deltaproteobacteria bacterium]